MTRPSRPFARVLPALALGLLLQTGCVFAPRSGSLRGRLFPFELADQVRKGMTADEVRSLLGEPLVRIADGDFDRWYYYSYLAEAGTDVYLYPPIKVRRAPARTHEAQVSFLRGTVVDVEARASRRERKPRYALTVTTSSALESSPRSSAE